MFRAESINTVSVIPERDSKNCFVSLTANCPFPVELLLLGLLKGKGREIIKMFWGYGVLFVMSVH